MGCGVCGAFPFLAGETTTVTNMGIIYTSSPIFIIILSTMFFKDPSGNALEFKSFKDSSQIFAK